MKFQGKALLTALLCSAMLLSSCGGESDTPAKETTGADTTGITTEATTVTTEAETETTIPGTTVIYSDEVENNMNVYRIKTFATAEEIDWEAVPAAAIDCYKWVECTEYTTWAKLVYVKDWGFICKMTCLEDSPIATYKNFDDPVCLDSCMEFFACFDGGKRYLNIESNSIGTLCAQIGPARENRLSAKRKLDLKKGEMFVVTPDVREGEWTLTMEIPIEKLQRFYPELTADMYVSGFTFTGNFYKTGSADITGNEHYGMWNEVNTENPDFHRPEYFGKFIIE